MNDLLKQLIEIKSLKEEETTPEALEEEEKKFTKKLEPMRAKANEVEHSTNTGYGQELIPVNVLTDTVLDLVPAYATILNAFMVGFQGNDLGVSELRPIVGDVGFAKGNSEWTTGAGTIAQGNRKLPTDKVTINQYPLIISVDISKREMAYSVGDLQAIILDKVAKSMVRTIESAIINGDPSNSSTWNVNLDDATPSSTFADGANDHRLLGWTGLRCTALSKTSGLDFVNVGTLTFADFITGTRANLGWYSTALNELVLLMDYISYNKAMVLNEFVWFTANGKQSTSITGALTNIAGVDLFVHKDFPATDSTGKVSNTAANNTLGSFLYARRQAVQRGYGKDGLEIDVIKLPWKGRQAIATMDFGFAIADKHAGITSPTVVLGYNAS